MILLIIANMFLASTFTLAKLLIRHIQPIYLVGVRACLGGIVLLLIQLIWDRRYFFIKTRHLSSLFQIAFFNIFLSYALEFWSFKYVSSVKVTLLYNLSTFITPFYAFCFFGQRMTIRKWIGLIIGFFGVMPILFSSSPEENFVHAFGSFSWPELGLLVAVASYCYGWVHIKKLTLQQYPPFMINGVSLLLGGIIGLIIAPMIEPWNSIDYSPSFFILLTLLIIFGNVISSNLYTILFKYYTITLVAFASLTIPLFAAIYGYFFIGETISKEMITSIGIICIGLYIFYQEELKQGYVHNNL